MDGQIDIFDLIEDKPPVPPFTVHTCVWSDSQSCGWCGKNGGDGGGAGRNPRNESEPFYWAYCQTCRNKYGYPRLRDLDFPVNIDRTQTPRPAELGPRPTKGG